jgi:hypothetical protein
LVRADRCHGGAGRFLFVMRGVNFSGNHISSCKNRWQASGEAFLSMVKDRGGRRERFGLSNLLLLEMDWKSLHCQSKSLYPQFVRLL